ncbi:unnamed protein product, partial [Staurois parvus]
GLGPPGGSSGRRTPRRSDRSRAPRRSGGRQTPRRSDRRSDRSRAPRRSGGRRGATGTESPGMTVGSESTGHDSGLRVNWHDRWHWVRQWIVWLDSGHRVTRHQVIWLDSGHRVIWQGSGLRVNWQDRGH